MSKALDNYIDAKITAYMRIEHNYTADQIRELHESEDQKFYDLQTTVIEPELTDETLDTEDPDVRSFIDRVCTGELSEATFCKTNGIGGAGLVLAEITDEYGY